MLDKGGGEEETREEVCAGLHGVEGGAEAEVAEDVEGEVCGPDAHVVGFGPVIFFGLFCGGLGLGHVGEPDLDVVDYK